MQLIVQTRLNPPTVIYDTEAAPGPLGTFIKSTLNPVVQVVSGNTVLYSSGEPYPDETLTNWAIVATVLVIGFFGVKRLLK
jgi:hypothetical protein